MGLLLITTAAVLAGILGLFALRRLTPQLVAATQLPSRSRQVTANRRQKPSLPREPANSGRDRATLSAPSAARTSPVLGKRSPERPPRTVAAEKAAYRRPATTPRAAPPKQKQAPATTCEIRVFRGYVKSQFYAEVTPSDGGLPFATAASEWFRWRKTEPPAQEPAAAEARDQLLNMLAASGWVRVGKGAEWYSDRLERRIGAV